MTMMMIFFGGDGVAKEEGQEGEEGEEEEEEGGEEGGGDPGSLDTGHRGVDEG